ncbi:hypothetical protein UFOVP1339_52 [uncultured Caudovirales phage]|uniref:Uncharacterized protein n=1 Tax=uncultured Caudovirales phage TaxID=2100421 RepID=A0A6J5S0Y9_9CAUD|nr:hypothetical protein UFOVP1339_52 [uncultured Caudovirales phage]
MTSALITDYTTLQASVAEYLNRDDLTARITGFIQLAEAKFNRELRVNSMLTRLAITPSSEYQAAPADWLESYSLELVSTVANPPIAFVGQAEFRDLKARQLTGTTRYYTLVGTDLQFLPAPSTATNMMLIYYAKIAALSTVSTNWLLTKSPDVYLNGSLLEAQPYLKDDDRLTTWAAIRQQGLDAIALESERAMRPRGQPLNARKRSF